MFKSLIGGITKFISNPVTWISLFGPTVVLKINYLVIRNEARTQENILNEDLAHAINNEWIDAISDFNMQCTIIIIAFFFVIYELVAGSWKIFHNKSPREIEEIYRNHTIMKFFILFSGAFILFGVLVFLMGGLASVENINLFKDNAEKYKNTIAGIHPPPIKFLIIRVLISVFSTYFTFSIGKIKSILT